MNAVCAVLLVLTTTGIVPQKTHDNFKLPSLHLAVYILMQKAVTLLTCCVVRKFLAEL